MGRAVRTIGSVRRSGKGGVSEMLAPEAQAGSDPPFGEEKTAAPVAEKEPLSDETSRPYQNRHRCAGRIFSGARDNLR